MSQITVTGGKPLKGRVDLKGAKNLVTKAMVAALLGDAEDAGDPVADLQHAAGGPNVGLLAEGFDLRAPPWRQPYWHSRCCCR